MKKKLIVFSSILVALSVFVSMTLSVSAKTIFTLNGYDYSVTSNTSVSVCGWDNRSDELSIPDAIMERKVTAIDDSAFSDNSFISSIDFSQASMLSTIGLYAFVNCTNISNVVTIPETVTKIKDNAFEGCSSIPSVNIEAGLTYIAQFTFHQCTALTEVKLPDSLLRIYDQAFSDCTNLQKVVIPESVEYISPSAFLNDSNLKIYGFADSYAQTYAHEHNIPFVEMVKFLLGDVDGVDGVNINDVTAIQSHLAELKTVEGVYLLAADANQDDVVDISDATAIQMKLAEYELPYPIGQYVTKEVVAQENN